MVRVVRSKKNLNFENPLNYQTFFETAISKSSGKAAIRVLPVLENHFEIKLDLPDKAVIYLS